MDRNAAAPPLRWNPSSRSHRIRIAIIAAVGALLATCKGLYQLRLISSVWDPVFGKGTERALTLAAARVMDRVFHLPDAILGAIGYSREIIFSLSGSTRRWQYRRRLVLLLGVAVLELGSVSAALSEAG